MIFEDLLAKIGARVEQLRSALILDSDGISVAEWKRTGESVDAISISVEYSRLLMEGERIASELGEGGVKELILRTGGGVVLFTPVVSGYSVVLILKGDRDLGLARYMLRVVTPEIKKEL